MTGSSGMREEAPMLGDLVELSVVVRDLDEAVERFTKLFGLRVHRRDESKTFGFKNAILPTGIGHIELLQPTDPDKAVGGRLSRSRRDRRPPTALSGSVGWSSSMWPMPVGRIAFLNPNVLDSSRRWTRSPKSFVKRSTASSRSRTTTDSSTRSPSMGASSRIPLLPVIAQPRSYSRETSLLV